VPHSEQGSGIMLGAKRGKKKNRLLKKTVLRGASLFVLIPEYYNKIIMNAMD
jgi:hypothetical protein